MKKPSKKEINRVKEFIKEQLLEGELYETNSYWLDAKFYISNHPNLSSFTYSVRIKACDTFIDIDITQFNSQGFMPWNFCSFNDDKGFLKIKDNSLQLSCMTKDGFLSLYVTKKGNFKLILDNTSTCRKYMA